MPMRPSLVVFGLLSVVTHLSAQAPALVMRRLYEPKDGYTEVRQERGQGIHG